MNRYIFLFVLFLSFATYGQENCANGIDDDGDGKIDLNDPDCSCNTNNIPSIIPNPSFEINTGCPGSFSELNLATPWIQATNATTDYFNSCGFIMPGILSNNLQNFPSGNGVAGALFLRDWNEYLGATLSSPMVAGTAYQLTLNIAALKIHNDGTLSSTTVNSLEAVKVTLYGCANGTNLPLSTVFSPNLADPTWFEIGNVTYTPANSWGEITITFTPTFTVNAIMIGAPPVLPASFLSTDSDDFPYFIYDNLLLNTASSFGVNISQQGNFCDNNLVLSANLTTTITGATYQWYKNGIAIIGATSSSYAISSFATNLGSYSVRVTSGTTCYVSSRSTINNTIASPTFTTIQPTCIVTTGTITVTTPALQYSFDNGVTWQSSPTRSSLAVGTYYVKIKTPSDCISSAAGVNIIAPQLLAGSNCAVVQPITCDGTGTITVTSSIAAQYSFDGGITWSTNNIASGLQPDTYQIKIKDAVGCESASQYVYINRVYLSSPLVTVVQPSCGVGGSITVTTPAAQYSFDDGVTWVSSNVASNLPAGSYVVKIKNSVNCESYTQYVYLNTFYLNVLPDATFVDPVCGTGGSITITTPAAQYSFDDGVTWSTLNTALNLAPGSYPLVIKDALGCISQSRYVYLNNFFLPNPSYTFVDPVCGVGGSITITTIADQYSFDNGLTWTTSNTSANLSPGTYYIMIKNTAGCTSSNYQYVNLNFFNLPAPLYTAVNPSCGNNGSILITTIALEYSFDGGTTWTTNPFLGNLSSGYYVIKVRDAINCESNYQYVSLENFEYSYPQYTYTDAGCDTYASITITSPADYYSFDNGANWTTNPFMGNLTGNQNYQIIARNGLNCFTQTQTIFISTEYSISPLATAYHVTACDALNDGSETINLTDYNGNLILNPTAYRFEYYTSSLGASTGNLSALITNFSSHNLSNTNNTVYVRVISVKNCFTVVALTFTFIDSPRIYMKDTYPLCEFRTVVIDAGSGFDSYLWSTIPSQITHSIVVAAPGNYSVVVTEDHGTLTCDSKKDFTVFLSNPATITSIETVDWTANENVIEVFVTGIRPEDYVYSLDGIVYQDSNIFENLTPGIYQVFVKDKNGCGIVKGEALLLNYPKFFTPNGDGINDTWYIKFSQFEQLFDVKIFDRQGKLIKVMNSSESWDGTYNGRTMPSDDYWFYVTREDGEIHKGHFAMKR